MTAQAAASLAVDVRVLAGPGDESAGVWAGATTGDPSSPADLGAFARGVDVLTFDHERVDPDVVAALERDGVVVRPGSATLRFADKAEQRRRLAALGSPLPAFRVVSSADAVAAFAADHGWPVVVKAARGGYDGRGVAVVADRQEAAALFARNPAEALAVVEPLLPIERELAVLVARRPGGDAVVYPVVETRQEEGMCRELVSPAAVPGACARDAQALALRLAAATGAVGILAVELFVVAGRLLVNELAPRPHNSGHHTIEGAITSQFENHLRAVLDWPLGPTAARAPAVATVNVIGTGADDPRDRLPRALAVAPAAHVHLYAKSPRPGRKLGHVTVLGEEPDAALDQARAAAAALTGTGGTP
jgi:5-(carboxyamino)imidazole ribonucleotide synthase